jgi:peptidoglycan/xylan/chitin deacetylase (PgdA/CDA1 family)
MLVLFAVGIALMNGALAGAATRSNPSASPAAPSTSPASSAPAAAGRTVVTFAWGGGNASQMPGLALFRQYGLHATYYIPSGLVCFRGQSGNCANSQYLTLGDIRKIAADGNEIGGLTVSHIQLSTLPAAEANRQICNDRVNLTRWGFRVTDFAYPFAVENSAAESLAARCGYNSGLGAGQVAGAGTCTRCGVYAETVPPRDPMLIRAPVEVNASKTHWTPTTFESVVRTAQQHGGGWVVFLIHDICPGYCQYGITEPQLRQVLSWVHSQTGPNLSVETVRQVIGGPVKAAVAGSVPPAIGGTGVANGNLADPGNGYPACFQPADYGSNSVAFRYRRGGGPGGAATETVSMTSEHSGDAKLLLETDLGECAPPVSAGRGYVVGAWYKSSLPTQFDVYYRNQVGDWSYMTSSARFAASATWKHVSWTTPAAPVGATAVSFGLAVSGVGQIATTGYSLAAAPPDRARTITFIALGLVLALPFISWKLWRPRLAHARGRAGSAQARGRPGPGGVSELAAAGAMAGSQWMAGPPPAHQMVIGLDIDDPLASEPVPVHQPDEQADDAGSRPASGTRKGESGTAPVTEPGAGTADS